MRHIDYDIKHVLLLTLIVLFGLQSCVDDSLYVEVDSVEEGMCRINAQLEFKQFVPSNLGSTRTSGDVYDGIRNLRVFIFNEDGTDLIKNNPIIVPTDKDQSNANLVYEGDYLVKMKFKMTVALGKYQIYAVANMPDGWTGNEINTVEQLKSVRLNWKETGTDTSYGRNDEMLGTFHLSSEIDTPANENGGNSDVVNIQSSMVNLNAKLIRTASKVTVAYDGSGLKDGVKIYIKSLKLKNIPTSCYLGKDNVVNAEDNSGSNLTIDGEGIVYTTSTTYDENFPGLIYNEKPYFPRKEVPEGGGEPTWDSESGPHSHTNEHSLFFYENLQGTGPDKSEMKDENRDGLLEEFYDYSQKPYGTYIEVEAYYESVNPERPCVSNITYRFMLGQNITTDYNAKRNCHYKLTLKFKGFANEPDWRIDYVNVFRVSEPKVVDYKGEFFVGDNSVANGGNNFSKDNIITISSYEYQSNTDDNREVLEYDTEYFDEQGNKLDARPTWFSLEELQGVPEMGVKNYKINYTSNFDKEVTLSDEFKKSTTNSKLAGEGANMNTANCYIVDAAGTYSFPLVYGNAIQNGNDTPSTYSGFTGSGELERFRNFLNQGITSAYIIDDLNNDNQSNSHTGRTNKAAFTAEFGEACNLNSTNLTASLVWQDAQNLISGVSLDRTGKGGISFTMGTMAEGNAVIAVKYKGVVMWSWHIWVTSLDLNRTLDLQLYADNTYTGNKTETPIGKATVMPVNLGWCSNGEKIRYYNRRVCKVKFTQKPNNSQQTINSQTITIIQEPHTALPQGNNPYFQWGRKDPSVGTNVSYQNKESWYGDGTTYTGAWTNPPFLNVLSYTTTNVTSYDDGGNPITLWIPIDNKDPNAKLPYDRGVTRDILHERIRYPEKFHNPRFDHTFVAGQLELDSEGNPKRDEYNNFVLAKGPIPGSTTGEVYPVPNEGLIDDLSYTNLWSTKRKTVYDPCPAGYKVSPVNTFSCFTVTGGQSEEIDKNGYNVTEDKMLSDNNGIYKDGNMMFYTDKNTKLTAVSFPLTGYRDYNSAQVYYYYGSSFPGHLYVWEDLAETYYPGEGWSQGKDQSWWTNNFATFFKAYRVSPAYIGVSQWERFYATDGCSVRPTKE